LSRHPRESGGPSPPADSAAPPPAAGFLARTAAFERSLLAEALAASRFNQRRAAASLGLTYDQLRHYLKKHALTVRPDR
jgi:psp operon transcriptional activator